MTRILLPALLLAFTCHAQTTDLDKTIAKLDSALFDSFNRCELEKFSSFFDDNAEFYHDQNGFTSGKDTIVDSVRKNICGTDVRRELVSGSVQVYPMNDYGAVQIGVHRFLHPKTRAPTGEARFIHLWQNKAGVWKITRVISFDHHTI